MATPHRPTPVRFDEAAVDAVFAPYDQDALPGAVVGVAVDGVPVYRKGFGRANIELPVPLSPTIRLRIASVSKHFVALAYLLLVEEGRAGLHDTLGRHLPELHPTAHDVTVRQLMSMTSGLRDAYVPEYIFGDLIPQVTAAELVELYRDYGELDFAPGTNFLYNNANYELLMTVIERITGQRLEDVLRERIFAPVGMTSSELHRPWDLDFVPNRAAAHMVGPTGRWEKWTWAEFVGAGGILSTIDDMLRWLAHMDAPTVGTPASWEELRRTTVLENGTETRYGLGLFRIDHRGVPILSHSGGGLGSNTYMVKVPSARLDVMVMVNRGDARASDLAGAVLDACLPDLAPRSAPTGAPIATGLFRSRQNGRVVGLVEGPDGQEVRVGGSTSSVGADPDGVLRSRGSESFLRYDVTLRGDPARPSGIRLETFGNREELERVELTGVPDASRIAGRYRNDALGLEVVVVAGTDAPIARTSSRFGRNEFRLVPVADDVWEATSPRSSVSSPCGTFAFDADAGGFAHTWHYLSGTPIRFTRQADR
jgi:CubicO group peptidase (beta-lactamase class C family)